jgi:hypothetical protein
MTSQFVTFISSDNTEFTLPLSVARRSGLVSKILKALTLEQQQQKKSAEEEEQHLKIPLPDIHSSVLDIICQFLAESDLTTTATKNQNNEKGVETQQQKKLDVSSALMHFDPNNSHDRQFVMEFMMACDYLSV